MMSFLLLPTSTILLYAIAAGVVSIYFPYLFVAYARFQVGFDMAAPRALFDKLPDYGKRATWAHQNCFETFTVFIAAALMAYVTGVDDTQAKIAAIAFVVARFLFSIFYILNIPPLRSLIFGVSSLSSLTLFILSISKATLGS